VVKARYILSFYLLRRRGGRETGKGRGCRFL